MVEKHNRHPLDKNPLPKHDDGQKKKTTADPTQGSHAQKIARLCAKHTAKYGKGWHQCDNREWDKGLAEGRASHAEA